MAVRKIELNKADTSNVTDMSRMFFGCADLMSLDVSGFDTSNVTDMRNMFSAWVSFKAVKVTK